MVLLDLLHHFTAYVGVWLHFLLDELLASPANKLISRFVYVPGIVRLILLSSSKRSWYDRVDDTVVLGILPFRSQTQEVSIDISLHPGEVFYGELLCCSWWKKSR